MGNVVRIEKSSFHWKYTEQPHLSRRIEILRKYPEIKQFMKSGGYPWLVVHGLIFLMLQFTFAYYASTTAYRPIRMTLTWFVGNWLSSIIMMHVHEASHGLVFGPNSVWKNRLYGTLMNFGLGVPVFGFFKRHHKDHHKYIGDEILDIELPTEAEVEIFGNSPFGKYLWFIFQPLIYLYRFPFFIIENRVWLMNSEELCNTLIMAAYGAFCLYNGYTLFYAYCVMSTFSASIANMFGYWGVMSHVTFFKSRETTSYYGWLNKIYLNFGYHMEHHDFPNVPSVYLPEINRIASEFYEDGIHFDSYHSAVVKFLFDYRLGLFSHLKRKTIDKNGKNYKFLNEKHS